VVVELVAPPLIASVLLILAHPKSSGIGDILLGFPALLAAAYGLGVLPCLAYAAAMECWFAAGMRQRCGFLCTVVASCLLGMGAGYVVQLLIPGGGLSLWPLAALDGLLVGSYLAYRYHAGGRP
jgi:hypothetical protein